jgi:hypothetical protein
VGAAAPPRDVYCMLLRRLLVVLVLALVLAPGALASGGHYAFDGGTPEEQAQVTAALAASSFDFSVIPSTVTVHIVRGTDSKAIPGEIWLDADLLDSGTFAWGVVQHEFAHEVDFLALTETQRAELRALLGGTAWFGGAVHGQLSCERFADLVAWAYWQSPDNVLKPAGATDEGGQMTPAAFRAALGQILPQARAVRQLAAVQVKRAPRKG